ncbi:hypothetical protein FOZ60_009340 [Perkinsus olseni]|uniref:Uncharacterized protein n=1 Tax=Perkinsus olseni TaxID=32597 RepID=A0A7J6NHU4_PEROL|nr:hypothetical protein FOZ60_009340 [Perkinsus olseni]
METRQSSSSIEDTGVDYPAEYGSFYHGNSETTSCKFREAIYEAVGRSPRLNIEVTATTVSTSSVVCPRIGDRPAFEMFFYPAAVSLHYLPGGPIKKLHRVHVFDPFAMETSRFRHQLNRLHSALRWVENPRDKFFKNDPAMKGSIEGICSAVLTFVKEIFTFEELCRAYTNFLEEYLRADT